MPKLKMEITNVINKRAIVLGVAIALLLFCGMFLTFRIFVEAEVLSKWYAFVGGGLLCGLVALLTVKTPKINIDLITILTTVFVGYLSGALFLSPLTQNNIHILSLFAFVLLYFSFKLIPPDYIKNIDIIILSVCVMQAFYGLMQYFGVFPTYKTFKVIGRFDNPVGFAACLAAGFPLCFSVINKGGWRRYFGVISLISITASIILSSSRAGMIALIIVSCIYSGNKYYNTLKKHRGYIIVAFTVLLLALTGLFFFKKDSAIGRVLVWKNSIEMIADNPILGSGSGSFLGNYMQYQADYFDQNPGSQYSMLANNVTHPFNEYLFLIIEYGIIGLLLLLAIVFVIIKYSKQISSPHLCLLSIGAFACFSYPLRYPFVIILIAYFLANIYTKEIFTVKINSSVKIVGVLLISLIFLFLIRDIQFEHSWGKLVQKSKFGSYEKLINDYEILYSRWNGDPMFLYNYGAILNRAEQHQISNEVLIKCTKYFKDYDVQMLIADNYYKLEQFDKADINYYTAINMIPSKFMPLYRLMLLYEDLGNNSKALEIANMIIYKPIKVTSGTVSHIQNEAKRIIQHSIKSD